MSGKAKFVREHQCKNFKNEATAIEQYEIQGKTGWYLNDRDGLHAVLYCPYCGAELSKEGSNE